MRIIFIILIMMMATPAKCAVLPQDMNTSNRMEALLDMGEQWQNNSMFHPLRISSSGGIDSEQSKSKWLRDYIQSVVEVKNWQQDSTPDRVRLIGGLNSFYETGVARSFDNLAYSPFLWSEAEIKQNFYAGVYVRGTNEPVSLDHYTGLRRRISRAGMNSAEFDRTVMGCRGEFLEFEIGRSREIWGPFSGDNLILSGSAPAFDRIALQLNYRKWSYRWYYGYLEAISDTSLSRSSPPVQRYSVGRALQYNNRRNFVFGIGEVSTLAGVDRPIDFSFLNPLAFHLEIEQNKRDNSADNFEDAIWFTNVDWLVYPRVRVSGAMLADDFQIDAADREKYASGLAWTGRIAWTSVTMPFPVTLMSSYTSIGTYVYQHSYRFSNLVNRGKLIGSSLGNDAEIFKVGFRSVMLWKILCEVEYGNMKWGSNSLKVDNGLYKSYRRYVKQGFPSGDVRMNEFIRTMLDADIVSGLNFKIDGHWDISKAGLNSGLERWRFELRYSRMLFLKL